MKQHILLFALIAAVFSSCTTAYKTGQTPDDVYYSPVRPQDEYVRVEKQDDRQYRGSDDYYEDRFLKMRLQDRYRWSALDDYYFYNTYAYNAYGNYYNWNSPWNSYWAWNNYYNPYCGGIPYYPGTIIIKNPRTYTPPSRALVFNPASYNTGGGNSPTGSRSFSNSYNSNNGSRYNNSNRSSNNNSLGGAVRKVFSNENTSNSNYNNNNNNSTPSRSYTPSSSSSSSSSSSGSSGGKSGGGVSRPPR
jgi:hypothetical protein